MQSSKIQNFASIFSIVEPNYFHHGYRICNLSNIYPRRHCSVAFRQANRLSGSVIVVKFGTNLSQQAIFNQCYISIPPENIRKPDVFNNTSFATIRIIFDKGFLKGQ